MSCAFQIKFPPVLLLTLWSNPNSVSVGDLDLFLTLAFPVIDDGRFDKFDVYVEFDVDVDVDVDDEHP